MLEREEKRVIVQFIRVFSDGHSEVLQGKQLEGWLNHMKIIENIFDGRIDLNPYKTFWVPIETPKIKPKVIKPKAKTGRWS